MRFHASLLDVLKSKTKLKITQFLLSHQAEMSEREIASILGVSHMSVNRTMRELADLNFVSFVAVGKAHLWRTNRKSYAYQFFSRLIGGLSDAKDPLESLRKTILSNLPKRLVKKVVLFGSVAEGTEEVNSDIDLFILVKDKQSKQELESSIDKLSSLCFEKYGNRLAPYVLTEREVNRKKHLGIIAAVQKAVQIYPEKKG